MYMYVYSIIVLFVFNDRMRVELFMMDARLLVERVIFRANSFIMEFLILIEFQYSL